MGFQLAVPNFSLIRRSLAQRLRLQRLVCGQLAARRRGHLQEGDAAAAAAILVEQRLEREKPLDDAFGEIPSLHAEPEAHVAANAVTRAHRFA